MRTFSKSEQERGVQGYYFPQSSLLLNIKYGYKDAAHVRFALDTIDTIDAVVSQLQSFF
jgi:hypothetical protein